MVYKRNPMFVKSIVGVSGIVIVFGLALYPIIIHPRLNPQYYREKQRWIRDKVPLEKTQPGGMKVWSDPFDRDKKKP